MGQHFQINSEFSLKSFLKKVPQMYDEYKWLKFTLSTDKRSLDANALSHIWYREISTQLGEDTIADVKSFCKLNFGVPILRQHEKFNNFYVTFFAHLSYPKQLAAMKYLSVSSIMDRPEMRLYMININNHFSRRGVVLSNANEIAQERRK